VSGEAVLDGLVAGCLLAGGVLSLLAGIGLVRFPDVLSRMHVAAKPQVLGSLLILLALAVSLRDGKEVATLLLIGVFQLATAPLAAQTIGRAAYRTGRLRRDLLVVDELAGREGRSSGPEGGPTEGEGGSRQDGAWGARAGREGGSESGPGAAPGRGGAAGE
jgi:multicomponent Na+:H+ antiporter subunit G